MSGLYTHTARITGESIDETKYNSDHQNHIDNHIPEMMDDYSANAAEMQTQANPGEQGSESLATSLAEELARLRFTIAELKGKDYWYETTHTTMEDVDRTNYLINGDFSVWQRGTSFDNSTTPANNDATLLADGWRLLSDGNNIVDIVRSTNGPSYANTALAANVFTTNKKWGICQFLEAKDTNKFAAGSQRATLGFWAKIGSGTTSSRMRAAIIEWTGTADAPTKDIVSSWEVEGTNPTLVANWAYATTPSTLTLTTSSAFFEIGNVVISDSATNIGVFIWMDDTGTTVADQVIISAARLVRGFHGVSEAFNPEPFSVALARCQRRFCKTFDYADAPAQGSTEDGSIGGIVSGTGGISLTWDLPAEMMKTPTVTTYSPDLTSADFYNVTDAGAGPAVGTSIAGTGRIQLIQNAASSGHYNDRIRIHATAEVDF